MKITIFGTGYVGLVTGACFAQMGNEVVCIDIDRDRVTKLNQGELPIFEPGLAEMLQENMAAGRISFTTNAEVAVTHGKVIFIAVGTPESSSGAADLRYVFNVAETIAKYLQSYKVIVDKSTVPVGTADHVFKIIRQGIQNRNANVDFATVSNPEFLKEGNAIQDFMKPDRIVLGASDQHAIETMRALYAPFNRNHDRLMVMDIRSAELTKYAANAMLATKISFMNELSNLAEKLGADIEKVRLGIGADPRIGYSFIYPGCGYGGSCFPKDIQALISMAHDVGTEPQLLSAVNDVNIRQKKLLFKQLKHYFKNNLAGKTVAIWGLAFKPNTDDIREAPSRVLIEALLANGAKVQAYDPEAMPAFSHAYPQQDQLSLCKSAGAALQHADALVVVTEWMEFRSPDFHAIKSALRQPVIFDGRNIYDRDYLLALGFTYYGIGRNSAQSVAQADTLADVAVV